MSKYIIEKYNLPLIWAQKVKKIKHQSWVGEKAVYENIGGKLGPFKTGYEAERTLINGKRSHSIGPVLSGRVYTMSGYTFWYEGEVSLTFKIPNVNYYKENKMFKYPLNEYMNYNLNLCGFDVVSINEFKGQNTKITVTCCNEICNETTVKTYNHFISAQIPPYCKSCASVVKSINMPISRGKQKLIEVRPDLERYYKIEINNNIKFEDLSAGSGKNIALQCEVCNHVENMPIARYTSLNHKQEFKSNFSCSKCNSLAVKYPEVAKEWDYKNNEKTPWDYTFRNGYRANWKCEHGHEWSAIIAHRTAPDGKNTNCPTCNYSKGELMISEYLKELNVKNIPQYLIKFGTVSRYYDFYLPEFNLYLEIHGNQHFEETNFYGNQKSISLEKQQKIDLQKQRYAEKNGYYMMINYSEHDPELALERFQDQFDVFLEDFINKAV